MLARFNKDRTGLFLQVPMVLVGGWFMLTAVTQLYFDHRIDTHMHTTTAMVVEQRAYTDVKSHWQHHQVRYVLVVDGKQYGCTTFLGDGGWCEVPSARQEEVTQTGLIDVEYDAELPWINRISATKSLVFPLFSSLVALLFWGAVPFVLWAVARDERLRRKRAQQVYWK
ncbi:hypothetical protein QCD60_23870 [Pokkaliibacter sp. MBI-7]|uniref:DUF3592 domain-containing protein n=1 Tax=Pokkaliibacter sp. MBI-7 TaxID=3040600 RepID=UPI0024482D76|nr:DUF3592 domain-containing protein [Pokkaliibacter sp. MBI-7]MDH2435566.1 hypothetical protein [Pokkaliibacter sp. MBI-7]